MLGAYLQFLCYENIGLGRQEMGCIRLIWVLLPLLPVEGNPNCFYVYQPENYNYTLFDVSVDTTGSSFNISFDESPQQTFNCNINSPSCCIASIRYNRTVQNSFTKLCGSDDMQVQVSLPQGTTYQAPGHDRLGKSYFFVCLREADENCLFVAVFVGETSCIVITFLDEHLLYDLRLDGEKINSTTVEIVLTATERYIHIFCDCDLTGVRVLSNTTFGIFSVFNQTSGLTVLPLLPIDLWKSEFKLVSINEIDVNETVVIVTSEGGSIVKVSGHSSVVTGFAGVALTTNFGQKGFLEIKGSSPLYIFHYGNAADRTSSSFLVSYPSADHSFICLGLDNTTTKIQLLFLNSNGTVDFSCEGNTSQSSHASSDVSFIMSGQEYLMSTMLFNETGCSVQTSGNVFGYIIINSQNHYQVHTYGQNAFDRIENYGFPSILYNTDNDTKKDSYGHEFVIVQPPYAQLKLLIACNGTEDVLLYNISVIGEEEFDILPCNGTNQLEAVNITTSANLTFVYRIKCTSLITVYVTGTTEHGLFAYLALPLNVLGYEYIALSYWNTSFVGQQTSTCLISSVYTNTDIYIFLNDSSQAVFLGDKVVESGQIIHLNSLGVVIIDSSLVDLSGIYFRGNKPFQLICGGHSTKFVFYEQLIPVIGWDMEFILRDIESVNGFDECIYRLITSDINTEIVVEDEDGSVVIKKTLTKAESLDLLLNDVTVKSNLGVLIVSVCSRNASDVSFSLVPGNQQMMTLPSKATEHFADVLTKRKIVLYRDGDLIASNIGALRLRKMTCMLTEKNSNPLSTDDCFYSGNGEHNCNCINKCTSCKDTCINDVFNPSNATLQERIDQLIRELTIDKTTLSSYRNKRISAPDPRESSRGIGSAAAVILSILLVIFVVSDIPLVVSQIKLLRLNISKGFNRFRAQGK